jgi:hypothetical protein
MAVERLRRGRESTAQRCQEVAREMAREAGVARIEYHERGLRGRAIIGTRTILVPRPTTRRRLYVFAHECGHIALDHRGRRPRHRQEYEAERYALEAMRRHGVAVPEAEILAGKRYVAAKILRAIRSGAKQVDGEAVSWCWDVLTSSARRVFEAVLERRVVRIGSIHGSGSRAGAAGGPAAGRRRAVRERGSKPPPARTLR